MKKIFLLLNTLVCIALWTACTNADKFEDALYFTGTENSPAIKYTINGPVDIGVTVTASCLTAEDQVIKITADPDKLESYNAMTGKNYKIVPEGDYLISQPSVTLKAGQNISDQLIFSLLKTDNLEPGATYCMPLTITDVTGGMPVLEASRTAYLILNQVMIVNAAKSVNMPIAFQTNTALESVPQVSMEARVKVTKFATSNPYISTVMGIEEHFLLRFGDVNIKPNQIQLAGGGYPVTGKTEFETNKWYHLAVVYDGATIKLYVNGELDGQTDAPRGPINLCGTTDKRRFCLGASLNSRLLNGYLSEVRVWKKALSQNEIQNNMCYVSPDNYKDMVAYWKFNEGNGSTVIKDWTGNGWDISKTLQWIEGVPCPD